MLRRRHVGLLVLVVVAGAIPAGIAVATATDPGEPVIEPAPTPSAMPVFESTAPGEEPVYSHEPIDDAFADALRKQAAKPGPGIGSPITDAEITACEQNPGAGGCDLLLAAEDDK